MEDVLSVYERPYNEAFPVICVDETSKQLISHSKVPLPAKPKYPERWDYEYVRHGVANLFMIFEPLAPKHHVCVTHSRTRVDLPETLRSISDEMYPEAEHIRIVCDNLTTHTIGLLYEAFSPKEALRLANRFGIHHTLNHRSWLDMAEIEIGVLSRSGLPQRVGTFSELETLVYSWERVRNKCSQSLDCRFTTEDARIKLKHLYPNSLNNS